MIVPLYEHQKAVLPKMHNGCILCGGVGSGKSRTALAYFWKYETDRMRRPKALYIITTARKRDSLDWEMEAANFRINSTGKYSLVPLVIDSWNNLHKYTEVKNGFFIFDEQRLVGSGAWVKNFIKITRNGNRWILLSATPGDTWMDYIPVFIANGYYRNRTEFLREHVVFSRFSKYPKVERYINRDKLDALKERTVVVMEFERNTESIPRLVECSFDKHSFMRIYRGRWNIFDSRPVRQAGEWCYLLRKVVNSDPSRIERILELFEKHKKIIIFYNFDYELEVLKNGLTDSNGSLAEYVVREYNGHCHQPIPEGERWIYLVQYNAASEAWNCITTDTIVFYSLNYSYKIMEQAAGRINRMNTPYHKLYYYILYSNSTIDKSILTALKNKRKFNEHRFSVRNFERMDDNA